MNIFFIVNPNPFPVYTKELPEKQRNAIQNSSRFFHQFLQVLCQKKFCFFKNEKLPLTELDYEMETKKQEEWLRRQCTAEEFCMPDTSQTNDNIFSSPFFHSSTKRACLMIFFLTVHKLFLFPMLFLSFPVHFFLSAFSRFSVCCLKNIESEWRKEKSNLCLLYNVYILLVSAFFVVFCIF